MPAYRPLNTQKKYPFSAKPPVLDKIVFTIDHIHAGNHSISSTYEVVKALTDRNIPVTVFIQATNPSNDYEFDRNNARMIYDLNRQLVTLGVHPEPRGTSQQKQTEALNIIKGIIRDITGKTPVIMSYHGQGAGPESGIKFSGIKYARGIISAWTAGADDHLNTPVMILNSVQRSFDYTHERNNAGFSATLFLHSAELRAGSVKRRVFDTYVNEVQRRRLQAVSYLSAMKSDFKGTPQTPSRPKASGVIRLSALTKQGSRPIKADFTLEHQGNNQVFTAKNVDTRQFHIPIGNYKIMAKSGGVTVSDNIKLNATQGLHHIFFMPV